MSSGFYVRPGLGKKLKSARWSGEISPLRFSWGNEVSWKQEVKETLEKWGTKTRRSGRWSRDRTVKKKKKKSLIFAWGDQSSGSSNGQTAPARRRFSFCAFLVLVQIEPRSSAELAVVLLQSWKKGSHIYTAWNNGFCDCSCWRFSEIKTNSQDE